MLLVAPDVIMDVAVVVSRVHQARCDVLDTLTP